MAEPTGAYKFEDLMTRVAVEIGNAYYGSTGLEESMVPITDRHDFLLVKGIVNRGIKLFQSTPPTPEGWHWRRKLMSVTLAPAVTGTATGGSAITLVDSAQAAAFADDYFNTYLLRITAGTGIGETATVTDYTGASGTFTFAALSGGSTPDTTTSYTISASSEVVNADPARYLLAQDFSGTPAGQPHFASDTAHSARITLVHESRIRANRSVNVITGYPSLMAIIPSNTSRRYEMLLDPSPSAADVIEFNYISHFDQLLMEGGTATDGSATTLIDTSMAGYNYYADDYFNGWIVTILSGTGKGQTATVTDWVQATSTFTFTALSGAATPDTTSVYMVQPASNLHPAGASFDTAILHACYAQAEMEINALDADWIGKFYGAILPAAFETNKQQSGRSRRLGRMTNGPAEERERTWSDITFS